MLHSRRLKAVPDLAGAGQEVVTMMAVMLAGHDCGQAGGALRETTQSRSHDPTAQPAR